MSRVEDVLAEHRLTVAERYSGPIFQIRKVYACGMDCGQEFDTAEEFDAHVAATLAAAGIGDTAAAEARGAERALREAADEVERNTFVATDLDVTRWLRDRAAREAARNAGAQATGLQVDLGPGGARQVHRPAPLTPPTIPEGREL